MGEKVAGDASCGSVAIGIHQPMQLLVRQGFLKTVVGPRPYRPSNRLFKSFDDIVDHWLPGLEHAHRSAVEDHVHRPTRLGDHRSFILRVSVTYSSRSSYTITGERDFNDQISGVCTAADREVRRNGAGELHQEGIQCLSP